MLNFLKNGITCWELEKLADTHHYLYLNNDKYESIYLEVTILNLQRRTEIHSFMLFQKYR